MGKVVILGGNARSGKTTLALKLQKSGYIIVSGDLISKCIEEGLKIDFDSLSKETKFNIFESIVNEALKDAINEDINVVIDMYDYLPSDIEKLSNKENLEVYFLAYPNCSMEEIKHNVIYYAKPTDWIAQVNEEYLNSCVERFYKRNKLLVSETNKYNMTLIYTKSGEEREKVLNKLFNDIIDR